MTDSDQSKTCGCQTCWPQGHSFGGDKDSGDNDSCGVFMRMIVCTTCGNKRCPGAKDHRNACTGSNAVGQVGSTWEDFKTFDPRAAANPTVATVATVPVKASDPADPAEPLNPVDTSSQSFPEITKNSSHGMETNHQVSNTVTRSLNSGNCVNCGKWSGAHAILPGQPTDMLCKCAPKSSPSVTSVHSAPRLSTQDACACTGPQGDCPCIRKQRGQKPEITETFVSPGIFSMLDDEDKEIINRLKLKALDLYLGRMRG